MKIKEFLNSMEFDYKINDNGTLSLVDITGANLNDIEDDEFEINKDLMVNIVDRLGVYIDDYFITDLLERLDELGIKHNLDMNSSYLEILNILRENNLNDDVEDFKYLNEPTLIDITEVLTIEGE
jgi:hypothetical protein